MKIYPVRLVKSYDGDANWSEALHLMQNVGDTIFFTKDGQRYVWFKCPCIFRWHEIPVKTAGSPIGWEFRAENPPHIEPSVLTNDGEAGHRCHIFLRGELQVLDDTVPFPT